MTSTESLSRRVRGRRKRPVTAAFAVLGLAGMVGCGNGGDKGDPSAAPPPKGCSEAANVVILGHNHIQPTAVATYNSTPPTSGDHYQVPAKVGIYADVIPNGVQVHNLEHGHVMIQYHDISKDQERQLEALVQADPRMVLLAPYPLQGARLAVTSWGAIQTCTEWSSGVVQMVRNFISAHRDHGRESIP